MPHKTRNARKEYAKKYYIKNKNKLDEKNKNNYQSKKEYFQAKQRKYRIENIETIKKKKKIYVKKNKIKVNEYSRKYINNRRHTNINYRILSNLRSRLNHAVKSKSKRTIELLGCTIPELRNHLEKLFKTGMTWENYGKNGWHIDHIIPCNSFNLTIIEQQNKCFHYTNLQPLWAFDNLSKGSKI